MKLGPQVYVCAVVLYLVALGCTLHSVNSQPFNKKQRTFWTVAVIAFPVVGIFIYSLACVLYATSETALMAKKK